MCSEELDLYSILKQSTIIHSDWINVIVVRFLQHPYSYATSWKAFPQDPTPQLGRGQALLLIVTKDVGGNVNDKIWLFLPLIDEEGPTEGHKWPSVCCAFGNTPDLVWLFEPG